MSISNLSGVLQARLRAELKPGEAVVWAGQPDPGTYMRSGFKIWFFFIPWTAFSLFWMAGASGFQMPTFDSGWSLFPLFGLPFLLIGIGGLSSPLWLRRKAQSMVYAITTQRVITIEGTKSITVKAYLPEDLGDIERTEHQDGSGDLIFHREAYRDSKGNQQSRQIGFFAISDVRRVGGVLESLSRSPT